MNKNDLIKKLENLDLPEVELPNHQRRLKMALLNSGYFKKQPTMSTLKKFVPVGALALVAIVAVSVISFTSQPSQASAQEIARRSHEAVTHLSPEQHGALNHTVGMDSRTVLQEAQSAKDLKVLTYDEFAGSAPHHPTDPDSKLRTLKFLQFTNANDQIVILGIDQNSNLPVFGSVRGNGVNPAGTSGEKSFNTTTRTHDKGLINCTIENGVEKCTEVSE